jgi:hypothetical protein
MPRLILIVLFLTLGGQSCRDSGTDPSVADGGNVPADAAAVVDGKAGNASVNSVTQVASATDLDAFVKAWCDWNVRCSSNYPLSLCDERRRKIGEQAQFAATPLALATTCFTTLSCERYMEDCLQSAATATAQSTPSRAALLSACTKRERECTGEDQLQTRDCHWAMLFSESMLPSFEACMLGPCTSYYDCMGGLH